ncbi:hypothetical protein [Paenibacillus apiarius]|uniref:hypothetical protein n=1 Tax=Paenibacillus apiarius TaxID=46240 RepID=UPI003B3B84E5
MKTTMKVAITTLSSILLLGSMNFAAEAASSPAVSNLTLKTAAAKPKAENEGEKLQKEEEARINKLLEKNPDDTYMVYVSNELTKRKGLEVFGMGNGHPEFTAYEDYLKKASTLKEAAPQQPVDLPDGYSFAEGKIIGPYSSEYEAEMKAEAKKLGKQIYSKKINWTHTNLIVLKYTNGEDYIELMSSRLDKEDKKQKGYTYRSAKEAVKKDPKLEKQFIKNWLSWNEQGKGFSISTNPGNPLTKDELIKLAKTMVLSNK